MPSKIIYAYDPLCGWCYGLIPALRHFTAHEPDVEIEVLPGGLFTGQPPLPYASLIPHIKQAEQTLQKVTGRKPSTAFHALITQDIDAASERPSHAVLQMNTLAPDRALAFAHHLQEIHYEQGADLNNPATYDQICQDMNLPALDTDAIVKATHNDPLIAAAYARCAALGPSGYPTIFIDNGSITKMPSIYDPAEFLQAFRA